MWLLRCYMMRQLGHSSRWLAGWVALAMASQPVAAVAQDRVQLNSITKIEVKGNTVEITGSRRPNFTTFTLSDPPRLVIDISAAPTRTPTPRSAAPCRTPAR